MKKIILTVALLTSVLFVSAQTAKKKTSIKKEMPKTLKVDTGVVFTLIVKAADMPMLLGSAQKGFLPWLHTTSTAMNQEEPATKYFISFYNALVVQIQTQNSSFDSIKKMKADTSKKVATK